MGEKKVMIIGLGWIGYYALEFLARTPGIDSIITTDIKKEEGLSKTRNVMLGASQMGFYPHIEFMHLDVNNIEETASILNRVAPDVIMSCVTLQSWWIISELPKDLYQKLRLVAGLGPWLPMHLTLSYKVMKAVKNAGIKTHVVVASFPDGVCPALSKVGLAPTIGLGNIDNFIPGLKKLVGERLGIPRRNVSIYLVSYHAFGTVARFGNIKDAPYYLRIFAEDKDVTGEFNLDQLMLDAAKMAEGWMGHDRVASSGVKNVLAILNNTGELTHSPGPQGLPGGYPVRLNSQGAKVVLPEDLSVEEAIRINEEGLRLDGIERIEDDGTVICTENAVNLMEELFEYDCRRIKMEENEEKAKELSSRYRQYVAKVLNK